MSNECPSVQDVSDGWNKYLPGLASLSEQYGRKILFTELGYKSTADSGITPWEWINSPSGGEKAFSTEAQANCYRAFFNRVWPQDWLAGVHLWQLRGDYRNGDPKRKNADFTPLRKPAEGVIADGFGTTLEVH